MTTRNDFSVEYNTSPRVAEIAAPSVEVVMQDVVDTLRKHEDSFQGMGFPKLVNASGKEDLGGGTSVGITVANQNTLLAFEARRTPAETGTVTGSPASLISGRQIIQDTAALFQTANVVRGSLVINFTDQSIADVISVDSETQLTTKTLVNGIGNTYDVTDVYQVFNVTQVKAVGGNLTAVDESQITIEPILPTAFTQVILTSSSSATIANQEALEAGLFFKGVTIDGTNGIESSTGLAGTLATPCKNDTFAAAVIAARKMRDVFLIGTNVITADHSDGIRFTGADALKSITVLTTGAVLDNCTFTVQIVTGVMDGNILIQEAIASNLSGFTGVIKESGIQNTLALGNSGNNGATSLTDVSSVKNIGTGQNYAVIDAAATGSVVNGDRIAGNFHMINKAGAEIFDLTFESGTFIAQSSCTGGTINIYGECVVTDNSGVGCTVNDNTKTKIIADQDIEIAALKAQLALVPTDTRDAVYDGIP